MRGFSDTVAPHQIAVESYGVRIQAATNSPEVLERIEALLPPHERRLSTPAPDVRKFGLIEEEDGTYSVYNESTRVNDGGALELSLVVIDGQMRSFVAINAVNRIFIHAGVVAHEGKALVFPGDSFAGKTTLTAALVKRGALYFSDEFAVIDPDGLVHPFPKTLSMRPPGTTGQQFESSVESLGGATGEEALPLGMAIVTYYVPGAEWSPRRLSPGEGALALLAKAVPARYRPTEAMGYLAKAVDGATVLEGERGEADDFAEMLLSGRVAAA
jgi:hypothetical protein